METQSDIDALFEQENQLATFGNITVPVIRLMVALDDPSIYPTSTQVQYKFMMKVTDFSPTLAPHFSYRGDTYKRLPEQEDGLIVIFSADKLS